MIRAYLASLAAWVMMSVTGGRPMERKSYAFFDIVECKPVFYYRDLFGRYWLATSPWAWFRQSVEIGLRK